MTIAKIAEMIDALPVEAQMNQTIESVTVRASEVEPGDLCFVESPDEAREAVFAGATAIVCNQSCQIETDIPVLRVENVGIAALRLAGSLVDEESVSVEGLDARALTFVKMILTRKKSVAFFDGSWKKSFERLMSREERLFFTDKVHYFRALRPDKTIFTEEADGYVVHADSLFRTTFKLDGYVYRYQPIPFFHFPFLQQAVALCRRYELSYDISRIGWSRHFRPVFTDHEPEAGAPVCGNCIVILSDHIDDIIAGRDYLHETGGVVVKTVVLVPHGFSDERLYYPHYYYNEADILEEVESTTCDYLFVFTQNGGLWKKIQSRLQKD